MLPTTQVKYETLLSGEQFIESKLVVVVCF